MERFSGWTQSNHTGLRKKRTFPNCDQKKKDVTMVSESEGGHVAGFEDGRRGPRAKKCKLLLEPESRPPLISSRKIVTLVLQLSQGGFKELNSSNNTS